MLDRKVGYQGSQDNDAPSALQEGMHSLEPEVRDADKPMVSMDDQVSSLEKQLSGNEYQRSQRSYVTLSSPACLYKGMVLVKLQIAPHSF